MKVGTGGDKIISSEVFKNLGCSRLCSSLCSFHEVIITETILDLNNLLYTCFIYTLYFYGVCWCWILLYTVWLWLWLKIQIFRYSVNIYSVCQYNGQLIIRVPVSLFCKYANGHFLLDLWNYLTVPMYFFFFLSYFRVFLYSHHGVGVFSSLPMENDFIPVSNFLFKNKSNWNLKVKNKCEICWLLG